MQCCGIVPTCCVSIPPRHLFNQKAAKSRGDSGPLRPRLVQPAPRGKRPMGRAAPAYFAAWWPGAAEGGSPPKLSLGDGLSLVGGAAERLTRGGGGVGVPSDTIFDTMPPPSLYMAAGITLAGVAVVVISAASLVAIGVLFQPRWMIKLARRRLPHVVFDHITKAPLVALTIDDGPNGETTSELLDILKANDCKATFFLIGANMDKYPHLALRMHEEGHEVGNHTMQDVASWRLTTAEFEQAVLECDEKLRPFFHADEGGKPSKWFRPGHGWYTKQMRRTIQRHGYRLALGSVYPVDPLFKEKGGPIAQYCLWKIYPGAIIVLHDRPQQANQTIEILSQMLPEIRRRGYNVVTLSELVRNRDESAAPGAEARAIV